MDATGDKLLIEGHLVGAADHGHARFARVPEAVRFVLIWAAVVVLAVAVEVGSLYFVDLLR